MANLLDTIKKNLGQASAEKPELGQTEQVQSLMRGKTGRAVTPEAGPKQSALGERIAARQTELGMQQLGAEGQVKAQQMAEQEQDIAQRTAQQTKEYEQQKEQQQNQMLQSSMSMLDQFERGERTLQNREDLAAVEQVGFEARMQNDQYIKELQLEGARNRLDDMASFETAMAQETFDNNISSLMDAQSWQKLMNADEREFQEQLARINADAALGLARDAAKAANTQAIYGAVSQGLQSVFQYGAEEGLFGNTDTDNTEIKV